MMWASGTRRGCDSNEKELSSLRGSALFFG
jgi:hypothetical protein